jgi:SWIM zinc finger
VDRCKVPRSQKNAFQTNHVIKMKIERKYCACGMWQEYGIPCVDTMAYSWKKGKLALQEIMESYTVNDFHKYLFSHELMKRNINPVIMDTLTITKEKSCLPL